MEKELTDEQFKMWVSKIFTEIIAPATPTMTQVVIVIYGKDIQSYSLGYGCMRCLFDTIDAVKEENPDLPHADDEILTKH